MSNKGLLLLLDAVILILQRGVRNFRVEIAGNGLLWDLVEKKIKYHNLEQHIFLLGSFSKKLLLLKYQSSHIFCLPTLREPGGVAILEAMACGLPIITSNYGGPSLSVTDECGIKIDLKDYTSYVSDLADALMLLINDREMRQNMGKCGRLRVMNEYSVDALSKKILDLYKNVINDC